MDNVMNPMKIQKKAFGFVNKNSPTQKPICDAFIEELDNKFIDKVVVKIYNPDIR